MIHMSLKSKVPSTVRHISDIIKRVTNGYSPKEPLPLPAPEPLPDPLVKRSYRMEKLPYARYIESVKKIFPVGLLVTYKSFAPQASVLPLVYTIRHHQELHYMVEHDIVAEGPKSVYMSRPMTHQPDKMMGHYVCPLELRPLTNEELELVRLKNQEPQGTA